jgi:hypothetical protein
MIAFENAGHLKSSSNRWVSGHPPLFIVIVLRPEIFQPHNQSGKHPDRFENSEKPGKKDRNIPALQFAQNLERLGPGLHRFHQHKDVLGILLVLDPLAQGMDGERKLLGKAAVSVAAGA